MFRKNNIRLSLYAEIVHSNIFNLFGLLDAKIVIAAKSIIPFRFSLITIYIKHLQPMSF